MKIENYKTSNHPLFKNKLILKKQDRGLWRLERDGVYLLFSSRQINIWHTKGWLIEHAPFREKIKRAKFLANVEGFNIIKREVSKEFGVYVADLLSSKSRHKIAEARHVIFYICREKTSLTTKQIALLAGNKNSITVGTGITRIRKRMSVDGPFENRIDKIINAIQK